MERAQPWGASWSAGLGNTMVIVQARGALWRESRPREHCAVQSLGEHCGSACEHHPARASLPAAWDNLVSHHHGAYAENKAPSPAPGPATPAWPRAGSHPAGAPSSSLPGPPWEAPALLPRPDAPTPGDNRFWNPLLSLIRVTPSSGASGFRDNGQGQSGPGEQPALPRRLQKPQRPRIHGRLSICQSPAESAMPRIREARVQQFSACSPPRRELGN